MRNIVLYSVDVFVKQIVRGVRDFKLSRRFVYENMNDKPVDVRETGENNWYLCVLSY